MPFGDSEQLREFLDARGLVWTARSGRLNVTVEHVCPHLKGNDCDLHNGEKPVACRLFPAQGQECLGGRNG